jgi:hypothetical protein
VNALALAALARRLRVTVVHGDRRGDRPSIDVSALLGEAAEAIEDLVCEREGLVEIWNAGLPALDGPCLYCEGRGCLDCGGSGRLPTKVGVQILSFLDRSGWWVSDDDDEEPEPVGVGASSVNGSGELTEA